MTTESELPAALGKVARRELALHGYTRLDQFDGVSASALLAIHGIGPKPSASSTSTSPSKAAISNRDEYHSQTASNLR